MLVTPVELLLTLLKPTPQAAGLLEQSVMLLCELVTKRFERRLALRRFTKPATLVAGRLLC